MTRKQDPRQASCLRRQQRNDAIFKYNMRRNNSSLWFWMMALILLLSCELTAASRFSSEFDSSLRSKQNDDSDFDLLMIGNSYIHVNSLDLMVKALLEEGLGVGGSYFSSNQNRIYSERFTKDAAQWHNYVNSPRKEVERVIMNHNKNWTWIVIQEQSQVPGFVSTGNKLYSNSLQAAIALDDMITKVGSETILLLTWGRLHGDSINKFLYPSFQVMQQKLTKGYLNYQTAIRKHSNQTRNDPHTRTVKIAPAGLAFQAIYDSVVESGIKDPTKPGNQFYNLYGSDGNHPSVEGTYLAACVLYATLTGQDPQRLQWIPQPLERPMGVSGFVQMNETTRDYLQSVAFQTVQSFQPENLQPLPSFAKKKTATTSVMDIASTFGVAVADTTASSSSVVAQDVFLFLRALFGGFFVLSIIVLLFFGIQKQAIKLKQLIWSKRDT